MPSDAAPSPDDGDRVLVCNPTSGDGQHTARVYDLAGEYDFTVHETESADDIVDKAARAAPDASILAAAGGDGTLTRVVRGLDRADAFTDTQFGIVPTGTGNNFAGNVGITDLKQAFEVMTGGGEVRQVDVGTIDDTPFLNSVVAGLTAESSAETDSDSKERWGVLAYAMTTVRTATEFDPLEVTIERPGRDPLRADAQIVMIGNGRRFPRPSGAQAHLEDGQLDVSLIEDAGALEIAGDSLRHAIGNDAGHVQEFTTPSVAVEIDGPHDRISVDGEIQSAGSFSASVRHRILRMAVGEGYQIDPDEGNDGIDLGGE